MNESKQFSNVAMLRLAACLLGAYLALVSTGFGPNLADAHVFRQTQTAITARYFSGLSDFLDYQTPVMGPPWSIPLEFPLYQALAKGLQVASGISLETSGRLVSVVFFLLCFWPMHCLLRAWNVRETLWVMAPVLLAPLYVFWSRAFMIETTALFFALLYLALFVRVLRRSPRGSAADFLFLTVVGGLAVLTKITTALPLLLLTGGLTAWRALRAVRQREPWAGLGELAIVQGVIVAVALAWVRHTDALKLLNPLGSQLTSGALRRWNFGSIEQRLDPAVWHTLAARTVDIFFPIPTHFSRLLILPLAVLVGGWLTLFVCFIVRCTLARRRQIAVLCGLFLLPFLLFVNLHVAHDYYQVANGLFLCLAFGLAAYGAIENAPDARSATQTRRLYAVALLVLGLCSLWYMSHRSHYKSRLVNVSALVRQMSDQNSTIVISGLDYSAELPYRASRRALMLPDWIKSEIIATALAQLRASEVPVSLYVACGSRSTAVDVQVREAFALHGRQPLAYADGCAVYPL